MDDSDKQVFLKSGNASPQRNQYYVDPEITEGIRRNPKITLENNYIKNDPIIATSDNEFTIEKKDEDELRKKKEAELKKRDCRKNSVDAIVSFLSRRILEYNKIGRAHV